MTIRFDNPKPYDWEYFVAVKDDLVLGCKSLAEYSTSDWPDADEVFRYPVSVGKWMKDPRKYELTLDEVKDWKKECVQLLVVKEYIDSWTDEFFRDMLAFWLEFGNLSQKTKADNVRGWAEMVWGDATYGYAAIREQILLAADAAAVIAIQPTVQDFKDHFDGSYPSDCSFWDIASADNGATYYRFWQQLQSYEDILTKIRSSIYNAWEVQDFLKDVQEGPQNNVDTWFQMVHSEQSFTSGEQQTIDILATGNRMQSIFDT